MVERRGDVADVFDSLAIGTMTARNRIVRAATAESLAEPSGRPTRRLRTLYEELASGGVGTIITGYAYPTSDGKPSEGALGICDDAFSDDYRALTAAVHGQRACIVLQLAYGGSKSLLPRDDGRWLPASSAPAEGAAPNASVLGASPIEHPRTRIVPREATPDDLASLADAFGAAAARAKACGFDGVEVHAAHGYLLSQFLSSRFNRRTDRYGGSLRNRARLAMECVSAVREAVGRGYPVLVKVNSCDDFDDPAGQRGGLGEDDSALVASWLVEAGASCIDVSGDWHAASARDEEGPYFAGFGARLARELDVPVVVTGGWRRLDDIRRHLADDGIAGVALCRPLICEPDLANRWQAGKSRPSACTSCGYCRKYPGIPCALRR